MNDKTFYYRFNVRFIRFLAVFLCFLYFASTVGGSYIRARAVEAVASLEVAEVVAWALTALGVGVGVGELSASDLSTEDKEKIFINGAESALNALGGNSVGGQIIANNLGSDLISWARETANRNAVGGSYLLTIPQTLWNNLRTATQEPTSLDFGSEPIVFDSVQSIKDFFMSFDFFGSFSATDSDIESFIGNNSSFFPVFVETSNGNYVYLFQGNYSISFIGTSPNIQLRQNPTSGRYLYLSSNNNSVLYYYSSGNYIQTNIISYTEFDSIPIAQGSIISDVFLDAKSIGMYDIVTSGRKSAEDALGKRSLTGDVALRVGADTDIWGLLDSLNAGLLSVQDLLESVGAIPVNLELDLTIPDTANPAISIDEAIEQAEVQADAGLDAFLIDLTEKFPFCIPFDIYYLLSVFQSEPEAPKFTWRFPVPTLTGEVNYIEYEIDLSIFDSVAGVVRTMETIAFTVGLAFVTRNTFFRT